MEAYRLHLGVCIFRSKEGTGVIVKHDLRLQWTFSMRAAHVITAAASSYYTQTFEQKRDETAKNIRCGPSSFNIGA